MAFRAAAGRERFSDRNAVAAPEREMGVQFSLLLSVYVVTNGFDLSSRAWRARAAADVDRLSGVRRAARQPAVGCPPLRGMLFFLLSLALAHACCAP
jgi:hypothetical protein